MSLTGAGLAQPPASPPPGTTTTTTTTTVVTTTSATPEKPPATGPLPLYSKACEPPTDVAACYDALREDVEWVATILQAKRDEDADKPAQDERLAKRVAALQSKGADLESPAGALTQARELLDMFFQLKTRKLKDEPVAKDLEAALERAQEPLAHLTQALHSAPPFDAQVLADVRLAVTRLLGIAEGLQKQQDDPRSNSCKQGSSIWCFGLIGSGTQARDTKKEERRVTNARIYLVDAYAAYKDLPHCAGTDASCTRAREDARRALLDALEPEGLRPFLVGFAKPSFVLKRAGDKTEADQALVVHFATRPSGGTPSLGVIGRFGIEPALDMIESSPDEAVSDETKGGVEPESAASFAPKLERAFVWDAGLRLSSEFGRDKWAASVLVRAGQTVRTQDFTAAKIKGKDANGKDQEEELFAAQLLGEQGDSNWYYEAGFQLQAFDTTLGAREARDLNVRRPVLTAEVGYRWDRRFRNNPAVKDEPNRPAVFGDQAHKRWYARFALDRLPVFLDSAKTGGKADVFLTFAVQHEGKVGALGLPSTTRVYVTGNIGFKL
jgi:hypothetical protein